MKFNPTESSIGIKLPDHASTESRLSRLEENQIEIHTRLAENTDVTMDNHKLLTEMSGILEACKLGLKVIGHLGKFVKWVGTVAVGTLAILGIYNAWHK